MSENTATSFETIVSMTDCNAGFPALSSEALASVAGGYRINDTIDNANRWGDTGALVGGGIGLAVGGPPGAAVGAVALGALGWLGGAIADSSHQVNAGKPNNRTTFSHWALH